MSCSIAPTPRSCISSSLKPKQRPISSEMMPTFIACIDALSPAPSASMRMHRSCSPDHLVDDRARQRLGLGARLLRLARNEVERVAAGLAASPYWRSQRSCASRWRVELAGALGLGALRRMGGGADDVVVDRQRVRGRCRRHRRRRGRSRWRHRPRSEAARAACSSPAPTRPAGSGRSAAGSSAPCAGRASGSSPAAPRVVMRKLLSGNGCAIQPTSRWTNMPTRSAWTSISSVGLGCFHGVPRRARGTQG